MTYKQEEKLQKILRDLLTLPANKKCAHCQAKGPVYANVSLNTFVCTTCSGIHREFNHRVKSIPMSTFKPEEVKGLQEGGNEVAKQKWLATWNSDEYPEPAAGDQEAIRKYMIAKYRNKKWVSKSDTKYPSKADHKSPKSEPLSNILGSNIPPITVQTHGNGSFANFEQQTPNFANFDKSPSQTSPNNQKSTSNELFELFSTPQTPPNTSQGSNMNIPQQQQQQQPQPDLKQQLGALYQQQAIQNQQNYMRQMLQMNASPQIFQPSPQVYQQNPHPFQTSPQVYQQPFQTSPPFQQNSQIFQPSPQVYPQNPQTFQPNPQVYQQPFQTSPSFQQNPQTFQTNPQLYHVNSQMQPNNMGFGGIPQSQSQMNFGTTEQIPKNEPKNEPPKVDPFASLLTGFQTQKPVQSSNNNTSFGGFQSAQQQNKQDNINPFL